MRIGRFASLVATVALVAAACGSSSSTPGTGISGDQGAPSMAAAGGGHCQIDITGGATVSFTSTQDSGTLQMDYWLNPAARSALALSADAQGFLMNCQDSKGSVSLTTADGTTAAQLPEGPGTYEIRAQLGATGTPTPGQILTLVNLHDQNIWGVSETGTLTVTTLTASRFAGSFQMKIATKGSNNISASVTGSFDLGCTSC
jgi:hypothetical protein